MSRFIYYILITICSLLVREVRPSNLEGSSIRNGRILHGKTTTINKHPWQISLQVRGHKGIFNQRALTWTHICGGSIIAERWVLTAASCIERVLPDGTKYDIPKQKFMVVAGVTNKRKIAGQDRLEFSVEKMIWHGDFRTQNVKYDIAIIKIKGKFDFKNTVVKKIQVPLQKEEFKPSDWKDCTITGWGSGGDTLAEVAAPLVSNKQCKNLYSSYFTRASVGFHPQQMVVIFNILKDKVCAGSSVNPADSWGRDVIGVTGVCPGDAGGPLVCTRTVTRTLNGKTLPAGEKVLIGNPNSRLWNTVAVMSGRLNQTSQVTDCSSKPDLWDLYTSHFQYAHWLRYLVDGLECDVPSKWTILFWTGVILLIFIATTIAPFVCIGCVYLVFRQCQKRNARPQTRNQQQYPMQQALYGQGQMNQQQYPMQQSPMHQQPMHQQPMHQQQYPMQQPMHQQPIHQQQYPMQQPLMYQQPMHQQPMHQQQYPIQQTPHGQGPMNQQQYPMQQSPYRNKGQ